MSKQQAAKFQRMGAQGDLLLIRVDALPDGLELATPEKGFHIVAHSESGHCHVVAERSAQLMIDKTNSFIAYLNVLEPCEVEHLREFDTHRSLVLDKGVYEVRRQREYSPEGLRRVQD